MPQKFIRVSRETHTLIKHYCSQKGLTISDFAEKAVDLFYSISDYDTHSEPFISFLPRPTPKGFPLPTPDIVAIAVPEIQHLRMSWIHKANEDISLWELGDLAAKYYLGKELLRDVESQIDQADSLSLAEALFSREDIEYGSSAGYHAQNFYWGDVYFQTNFARGEDFDFERGAVTAVAEHVCKDGEIISLTLECSYDGDDWKDLSTEEKERILEDLDRFDAYITELEVYIPALGKVISKKLRGSPSEK